LLIIQVLFLLANENVGIKELESNSDLQENLTYNRISSPMILNPQKHLILKELKQYRCCCKKLKVSIKHNISNSFDYRWESNFGNDYVYSFDAINKVYPLIRRYNDFRFKINQLNVNKYAFHKNKFPVEAFLHYSGTKKCNS
jgi:hypothetical protein